MDGRELANWLKIAEATLEAGKVEMAMAFMALTDAIDAVPKDELVSATDATQAVVMAAKRYEQWREYVAHYDRLLTPLKRNYQAITRA
jgi:hypothetical protein